MKKSIRLALGYLMFYSVTTNAQCTHLNVPYYEGLAGITANDQLPTCWAASNMSTTCRTFTSTSGNYGAFYYTPAGQNYFYSPGFHLKAGAIYSVSCWYKIIPSNNSGWSNLEILMGPSQSTTGLQTIAVNSAPNSINYSPLSATLTVSTTGNYHFAIGVASSGGNTSSHLMWDDFTVEIPCSLNAPTPSVTASPSLVCEGDTVTYYGFGADTYTWCGGVTGNPFKFVPSLFNPPCSPNIVMGSDTLSGCSVAANTPIQVFPKPNVNALANPHVLCKGKIANLNAFGASTYTWNFFVSAAQTTVAPSSTTQYTVTGFNQYGCWNKAVVQVSVNQLPVIGIPDLPVIACALDSLTLTPSGATSYTWQIGSQLFFSNPLVFMTPAHSATILLTGMDGNGCVNTFSGLLNLNTDCFLGMGEGSVKRLSCYPNPGSGTFYLENVGNNPAFSLLNGIGKKQKVDVRNAGPGRFVVDLNEMPDGLYILMIDEQPFRILKESR